MVSEIIKPTLRRLVLKHFLALCAVSKTIKPTPRRIEHVSVENTQGNARFELKESFCALLISTNTIPTTVKGR